MAEACGGFQGTGSCRVLWISIDRFGYLGIPRIGSDMRAIGAMAAVAGVMSSCLGQPSTPMGRRRISLVKLAGFAGAGSGARLRRRRPAAGSTSVHPRPAAEPAMAGHGEGAMTPAPCAAWRSATTASRRSPAGRRGRAAASTLAFRIADRRGRDRARLRRRAHQAHARDRRAPRHDRLPAPAPDPARRRHLVGARDACRARPATACSRDFVRTRHAHARRRPHRRRPRPLPSALPALADERRRSTACGVTLATAQGRAGAELDFDGHARPRAAWSRSRTTSGAEGPPRGALRRGRPRLPPRHPDEDRLRVHGDVPDRRAGTASSSSSSVDGRVHTAAFTQEVTAMSAQPPIERVELPIGGMTCASCATRDREQAQQARRRQRHRQLRHREGAGSSYDPAARSARASSSPPSRPPATRPRCPRRGARRAAGAAATTPSRAAAAAAARLRGAVGAGRSLLAMVPALQFDYWQWLSLQPRHAGGRCGGRGRSTGRRGPTSRHGAATHGHADLASARSRRWLWSLYALFLGDAGHARHDARPSTLIRRAGDGAGPDLPRGRRRRRPRSSSPAATSRRAPSAAPAPR